MKKLLPILLVLFSSCAMYNNTVTDWHLSRDPIGYDTKHFDAQNKPLPIYAIVGTVNPTWRQAWNNESDSKFLLRASAGLIVASTALTTYQNAEGNSFIVPAGMAIAGLFMAGSSMEWGRWNDYHQIQKPLYDSLMKADGNLAAFWNSKPWLK